jgi:phosphogluconate dehydratase
VLRFQGPKANGMPELHKLTPIMGLLQDKGFHVALLTDGRMSGASGKVPSAIHMWPECIDGGPLAKVQNGDLIVLNTQTGEVNVQVDQAEFDARVPTPNSAAGHHFGMGRELFGAMRAQASTAETGATNLFFVD